MFLKSNIQVSLAQRHKEQAHANPTSTTMLPLLVTILVSTFL